MAKFDKDGKFLMDWGTAPKDPNNPGPNEWNTVHSIAISNDRRVFVVDRGHHRIQVFDENGKFLDMWTTGVRSLPYAHLITTDQFLWIADGGTTGSSSTISTDIISMGGAQVARPGASSMVRTP